MKELSFFQLKNVMGAKMRKGFKSFCNNDTSTSTLDHQTATSTRPVSSPNYIMDSTSDVRLNERGSQTTLEEMLLRLDMEENMTKLNNEYEPHVPHRMSCVNSSDILRTARNALNQYPRFSLDGKDAMYRSSFRDMSPLLSTSEDARKSIRCNRKMDMKSSQTQNMPPIIRGEKVIWCKPGVVAKLMGLEAMPMSISMHRKLNKDTFMSSFIKRQSLRKRVQRYEMENKRSRGRVVVGTGIHCGGCNPREMSRSSCSRSDYGVMKPVAIDLQEVGWPMRGEVLYKKNDGT
ncbi:hypothetical protein FXO38_16264 [Capsicum annuum]|uniref:uncharacterized protein LOC124898726 n=1 Tax=Capsicum annuum TaxID=4072 RepID=UPI001FB0C33F|nr:uncharacterized protein LOC124898726 [Capsicum annuum]KAF3652156.1 hypothetical protein FXO38_16264 [Capsicum annuum]KAF3664383.1 hypothetical protein FXO37_11520 [Capsicum annuum]